VRNLSERDRAILAIEKRSWRFEGAKQQVIRETLGLSPTRYYQVLNELLDDPAALSAEPIVIRRLQRQRQSRRRSVSSRA
jgi:DNA-binding Lrp family transcriptional regulator